MSICSSSMWSRFCKKYKQGQAEPPAEDDNAATPHKKRGIKRPTEGSLPPASDRDSLLSLTSSDPHSFHASKPVKNERSALSVLQGVLLGHD